MIETLEKTSAMKDYLVEVNRILEKNNYSESRLIPILQEVQKVYKYLSKDMIAYVAEALGVPPSRVYGVATFYAHFSLQCKGKHIFRLCDGTACHIKGSNVLIDQIYKHLGIKPGETTSDGEFSIETVNCLGACALAPVLVANDRVHPKVTSAGIVEIIKGYGGQINATDK